MPAIERMLRLVWAMEWLELLNQGSMHARATSANCALSQRRSTKPTRKASSLSSKRPLNSMSLAHAGPTKATKRRVSLRL